MLTVTWRQSARCNAFIPELTHEDFMRTSVYGDYRLPHDLAVELGLYRYRIFVEQLGWKLPTTHPYLEQDQFDRDDTVYVFARNNDGNICGCARLLPTTRPYLLQELFPSLLAADMAPPQSPYVWELSRFAASTEHPANGANPAWAVRPMLAATVACAARLGARQLIGVTFMSMERLFRRIGVHAHRAGPAQLIDGRMAVACWIDIDQQTLSALDLDPANCMPPLQAV